MPKKTIIVNHQILECDGNFVDEGYIKKKCKDCCQSLCMEILRLLKDGNRPEGMDLLPEHNQGKQKK